jgi:hypothetical protein
MEILKKDLEIIIEEELQQSKKSDAEVVADLTKTPTRQQRLQQIRQASPSDQSQTVRPGKPVDLKFKEREPSLQALKVPPKQSAEKPAPGIKRQPTKKPALGPQVVASKAQIPKSKETHYQELMMRGHFKVKD